MEGSFFYRPFVFILIIFIVCIFSFSTLFKSLSIQSGNFIIQNDVILSDFSFVTDISNFVWPTPGYNYITSPFGYRTSPTTGARLVSQWN